MNNLSTKAIDKILEKVLFVAQHNLYTEDTPGFLQSIGANPKDDWCAIWAGYCYRRAYSLAFMDELALHDRLVFPHWVYKPNSSIMLQKGARALVKQLGAVGRLYTDPREIRPGDLFSVRRGTLSWTGHVGICQGTWNLAGHFGYFAGNEDNQARHGWRDPAKQRGLMFASLHKEKP